MTGRKDWILIPLAAPPDHRPIPTTGAGTNPARTGQTAGEIAPGTAPPDRILAGEKRNAAPGSPAGPNPTDQIKNGAMAGWKKERGAWDPRVVGCGRARVRIPAGAAASRRRMEREGDEEERKGGEERRIFIFIFFPSGCGEE